MFNNISWQSYWVSLAFLLTGYYLLIYLLYYRTDFKISFKGKRHFVRSGNDGNSDLSPQHPSSAVNNPREFELPVADSEEHLVYALMDELAAYFEEARRIKIVKEEFLYSLQKLLAKYPTVRSSSYKESVTNVIVSEAEHVCSIHISAEEMVRVWTGA